MADKFLWVYCILVALSLTTVTSECPPSTGIKSVVMCYNNLKYYTFGCEIRNISDVGRTVYI